MRRLSMMLRGRDPELAVADQSRVLTALLAHSETQLLAQIADETSLDGQIMGLLGFSAALLAADIAAKDLLGTWWWTPLPFVGVAAFLCLRSTFGQNTYLGPEALGFYATFGGQTDQAAREQLLADLDVAFQANSLRAREKAAILQWALGILTTGLVIAALLIVFDTPSKVRSHVHCSPVASAACPHSTQTGARSGPVGIAAGRTTRHDQVSRGINRDSRL